MRVSVCSLMKKNGQNYQKIKDNANYYKSWYIKFYMSEI